MTNNSRHISHHVEDDPVSAFIDAKIDLDAVLDRIRQFSDDHFNISPDRVEADPSYAYALRKYVTRLTAITDAAFGTDPGWRE